MPRSVPPPAPEEPADDIHDDGDDHNDAGDPGIDQAENNFLVNGLDRELKVVDQYPKPGMKIAPGGTVFLYWE